MDPKAQKTLEQIQDAAAEIGGAALDATLGAIYLEAISYTLMYGLTMALLFGCLGACIHFHQGVHHKDLNMIPPGAFVVALIIFATVVYFGSAAWMGIVSPEAALAHEVMGKL
jgi:hypothetical protein